MSDADKIFDEIIGAQKVRNPELRALIEERMKAGGEVHAANGLPLTFAQDKEDPDALQNWMRERQFGKIDIPAPYKVKPEEVTVARAMGTRAPEMSAKDKLRNLLQEGVKQGKKEIKTLGDPNAVTDLVNRGLIANNPVSGAIDLVNMGLEPFGLGSEMPIGGSAHVQKLMKDYGFTKQERPLLETGLALASPFMPAAAKATEGMTAGLAIKPVGGQFLNRGPSYRIIEMRRRDEPYPGELDTHRNLVDRYRKEYEADPTDFNLSSKERAENELADVENRTAVYRWMDTNLQNYGRKYLGTKEDPVLKLAEQGILHMPYERAGVLSDVALQRETAGFPAEGTATTDLGQMWENMTDREIKQIAAGKITDPNYLTDLSHKMGSEALGQLPESVTPLEASEVRKFRNLLGNGREETLKLNPWLEKLDPNTPVYDVNNYDLGRRLGFDHVIDVLKEDLAAGRLRADQLPKMSVEQAVRRTAAYDAERAAAMEKASAEEMKGMTIAQEFDEGYKMVQLDKPGQFAKESDRMGHSVRGYEPSKSHEDWSEASGNSGHSTYGHGGWDAIKGGEAQVFSLRDTKNKPHATIEMMSNPQPYPTSGEEFAKLDSQTQAQYGEYVRQWRRRNPDVEELTDKHVAAALAEAGLPPRPPVITQIKGKQNAAPKEDYLPMIQKFIREGNYEVEGDLENAGLIDTLSGIGARIFKPHQWPAGTPRYITENEADNIRLTGKFTPDQHFGEGGMKRGGEVHMAGGGDAAKALAKALKASEALGGHEGKRLFTTQSDRTKVGGKYLGGPGFSSLQLTNPLYEQANAVWGVGEKSAASKMINAAKRSQEPSVWTTMLGSPEQHRSNQQVFDELLKGFRSSAKKGNLDPDLHARINAKLAAPPAKDAAPVFEEGVDILDPKFRQIADTFDKRAHAASVMSGEGLGGKKGQIIDYEKILRGSTDPMLTDVPTFSMGPRLFELHGDVVHRPDLHPAFPVILTGKDFGTTFDPVPRDLMLRDFVENMIQTKGRKPGYMDLIRNTPSQFLSEDFLTGLQKAGYKQGGTVTKSVKKRSKNG